MGPPETQRRPGQGAAVIAVCFTKGRVRFESPEGESAQPTQGQAFFYFGPHLDRFRGAFTPHGLIMLPDAAGAPRARPSPSAGAPSLPRRAEGRS